MRMFTSKRFLQCLIVVICAYGLKLYYSTASADELRWILAPTTAVVELITGVRFVFEPHAGYMNPDRSFLIASSCAGVNFLITAFLMLSIKRLVVDRRQETRWTYLTFALLIAFLTTLIANATRIIVAMQAGQSSNENTWLHSNEFHRLEGIIVYFVFLLLLFVLTEDNRNDRHRARRYFIPLVVYYGMALVVPIVNGVNVSRKFLEHSIYVLLVPLIVVVPVASFMLIRGRLTTTEASSLRGLAPIVNERKG
jgi:exosortase K